MSTMAEVVPTGLEELLDQNHISDYTITCRSKEFKVHQTAISGESEFFRTACTKAFKVR
jgi:BTB/POZ domain